MIMFQNEREREESYEKLGAILAFHIFLQSEFLRLELIARNV